MSKDEALKQALEVIEAIHTVGDVECVVTPNGTIYLRPAIADIKEALTQPEQEPVDCYGYAARLATSIWKQHYQKTAPQWQVLDDLIGVLTQIDNMAAGLISAPLPVQPEQEPVAWEQFHEHLVERNFCQRCGKRTADLTTIHTCTPPVAADS